MIKLSFSAFRTFINGSFLEFISDEEAREVFESIQILDFEGHQRILREDQPQNLYFCLSGEILLKHRYFGFETGRVHAGQSLEFKTILLKQPQWTFDWQSESPVAIVKIPWIKLAAILTKYPIRVSYLTKLAQSVVLQKFKRDLLALDYSHEFVFHMIARLQMMTNQNFSSAVCKKRFFFIVAGGEISVRLGQRTFQLQEWAYKVGDFEIMTELDEFSDFQMHLFEGTKLFVLTEKDFLDLEAMPDFSSQLKRFFKIQGVPGDRTLQNERAVAKASVASMPLSEGKTKITEATAAKGNGPVDARSDLLQLSSFKLRASTFVDQAVKSAWAPSFQFHLDETATQGKVACIQNLLLEFRIERNVFDILNRESIYKRVTQQSFCSTLVSLGFDGELVAGETQASKKFERSGMNQSSPNGEFRIYLDAHQEYNLFHVDRIQRVVWFDPTVGMKTELSIETASEAFGSRSFIRITNLDMVHFKKMVNKQKSLDFQEASRSSSSPLVGSADRPGLSLNSQRTKLGILQLFRFVAERKKDFALVFVLGLLSYFFSLAFPFATQYLLDQVIQQGKTDQLPYLALILLSMSIMGSYFDFIIQRLNTYLSSLMTLRLKSYLHANILSGYSHSWINRSKLISRIGEIEGLCQSFMNQVVPVFSTVALSLFTIYIAYWYHSVFAWTFGLAIPLTFTFIFAFRHRIEKLKIFGILARERETETQVKAYDQYESRQLHRSQLTDRWRFEKALENSNLYTKWSAIANSALQILQMVKSEALRVVTFFIALKLHLNNQLTLGQVLALTMLAPRMGSLLQGLVNAYFQFLNIRVGLDQIANLTSSAAHLSADQNREKLNQDKNNQDKLNQDGSRNNPETFNSETFQSNPEAVSLENSKSNQEVINQSKTRQDADRFPAGPYATQETETSDVLRKASSDSRENQSPQSVDSGSSESSSSGGLNHDPLHGSQNNRTSAASSRLVDRDSSTSEAEFRAGSLSHSGNLSGSKSLAETFNYEVEFEHVLEGIFKSFKPASFLFLGDNQSQRFDFIKFAISWMKERAEMSTAWKDKRVATIGDGFNLFTGTLLFNLTFDERTPDLPRLMEIIGKLGFDSLLLNRPDGLNYHVQGLSTQYSPSEIIKIQIVRALYLKAEILLFENMNQYLDHSSEAEIYSAIQKIQSSSILLWSTTNFGLAKKFDQVVHFENGQSIIRGPHKELLKSSSHYAQFLTKQIFAA